MVHITVAPLHKLLERGVEKCPSLTCSELLLQQNIYECETVHSKLCDIIFILVCVMPLLLMSSADSCVVCLSLAKVCMHNSQLRLPAECTQESAFEIILHTHNLIGGCHILHV